MSRSGVGLGSDCIPLFEKLKNRSLKYIVYKLSEDKKSIVQDSTSEGDEDFAKAGTEEEKYELFLQKLPESDCRYALYDLEYELASGEGKRSKICFYTWSPDNAPVRSKMVYASSKDALRRSLAGVHVEIQGSDFSEVSHEEVLEKAQRGR